MSQVYQDFIQKKSQLDSFTGFTPLWLPDFLFDFQSSLTDWSLRKGKSALFEDCGLGKTVQELVWAENVIRHTNSPVLIVAPLAVSLQTVRESEKFGIDCKRSNDGTIHGNITVTNYERLHLFNPSDFSGGGVVADESGILKNFDGATRNLVIEFMKKVPYRLLATATAAPNDYPELGNSSEALGELGYMDMLGRFFKNDQNTSKPKIYRQRGSDFAKREEAAKWRFKGHSEQHFWRWVSSWARAMRKPSDLGFADDKFILPPLIENQHLIDEPKPPEGFLFTLPAIGLKEQRDERRRTIEERCEKAASLVVNTGQPAIMWCDLNPEGDLLEKLVPDAIQISGRDSDEAKEDKFLAFISGQARVLVTKPKIGAWGLNLQHCAHMTCFPSHSYESYYQRVRRCWRFGQTESVIVDMITGEGESSVLANLQKKSKAADHMFTELVRHMMEAISIDRSTLFPNEEVIPEWL